MKKYSPFIYKLIILVFLFFSCCVYADISVNIMNLDERNSISTDDIIELEISTNNTSRSSLDLSPLTKDFIIISQGKQVSHAIINGNSSSQIKVLIGLRAKRSGNLQIPVIAIGNDKSKAIAIKVLDATTDPNLAKEIFMNIETDNQSVYLQSPLKINVNIYAAADITVRDLELSSPDSPNQMLFKLNELNKQISYKNKRYNFLQVTYLAFYNQPGNISLPKFHLSGLKLKNNANNNRNDLFSLYQQQWVPFTRSNPELKINVLNKPTSFHNIPWLAADNIKIEQTWTKDNSTNIDADNLHPGDAIQRTITITGTNIPAEYLPALYDTKLSNTANQPSDDGGYKIYVDKPDLTNKIVDQKLHSTVTQKITYILTKNGNLALPAHKITWWNNKSKSIQYTTIESRKFHILGSDKQNLNMSLISSESNAVNSKISTSPQLSVNNNKLIYLLIGLIFVLSIVIIYLIIIVKKITKKNNQATQHLKLQRHDREQKKIKSNKFFSILKSYAKNNDAQNTYKTLCESPNTELSLIKMKNKLSLESQKNINNLTSYLYGNSSTTWDAKYFIKAVIPELKKTYTELKLNNGNEINQHNFSLPDLYPK